MDLQSWKYTPQYTDFLKAGAIIVKDVVADHEATEWKAQISSAISKASSVSESLLGSAHHNG